MKIQRCRTLKNHNEFPIPLMIPSCFSQITHTVRWAQEAIQWINTQFNRKYSQYTPPSELPDLLQLSAANPFAVSCLSVPAGPTPWWLIQSVIVVAVLCIHPSDGRFNLGLIYSKWLWFPVWLEEVNIECPRPVLKHSFLCDEAMMAALPSPLMWNVHCAFVGSQRFIVMIRYWKMIRIPAEIRWHHAINIYPVTQL